MQRSPLAASAAALYTMYDVRQLKSERKGHAAVSSQRDQTDEMNARAVV